MLNGLYRDTLKFLMATCDGTRAHESNSKRQGCHAPPSSLPSTSPGEWRQTPARILSSQNHDCHSQIALTPRTKQSSTLPLK